MYSGNISKLKSKLVDDRVEYQLPLSDELIALNPLIGKNIKMQFDGQINCVATGKQIKKAYGQGYSWEAYQTLPECDSCIMRPELCHYAKGTCRDPSWGEKHCFIPHIVYIANTGDIKVGITRHTQVPTRWIDQGATSALAVLEVKDRRTSGLIEVEIAKKMSDKTNWRKMLKGDIPEIDLEAQKAKLVQEFKSLIDGHNAKNLDVPVQNIHFPVECFPEKIKSLSFDKTSIIESKLLGIKGQYLILESGVINMRRHQGYFINFSA